MKIRRNNFEDIYPAGPTYIRGVRAGDTLYISGTTARGSEAQDGPPMAQLRAVLDRIVRMVEAEGGKATDIVKLTTYVTDRSDYWPIEGEQVEIFEHYFAGEYPANALIEVSGLAEDGLCIEIEATAVLG